MVDLSQGLEKLRVQLLGEEHANQLSHLRKSAYAAGHSGVELSALGWSPWDRIHFNLGVFYGGELISSMRVAISTSPRDFEICFLHSCDASLWGTPFAMIHRLATKTEFQGRGFSSLLRYHAIRISKSLGCKYVYGGYWAGTRQDNYFKTMGYSVHAVAQGRLTEVGPGTSLTFIALDIEQSYVQAISTLEEGLGEILEVPFDINMETLRLKYGK